MASDASAHPAPVGGESALARLGSGKYLLVTTHRKDGRTVPTPVWVVRDGDALVTTTVADSGKVKRIRNRADVLVAPCDIRGNRTGEDIVAHAELVDADLTERYQGLIRRKYGLIGRIITLGSRLRRGQQGTVGLRITLTAGE
jgi:PPOX class probable F420-dependent enzyme